MDNKEYLTREQLSKKETFLFDIEKEIEEIENQLRSSNIANFRISSIKNLKISLAFLKRVAPYILTAGIVAEGFKFFGLGYPFYSCDTFKFYLNTTEEFDSIGNIRYEQEYDKYQNHSNTISHYSAWKKIDDNFYSRSIESYQVILSRDEILSLFNEKDLKLNDILGKPISIKKEIKNNLSNEELLEKDFLQAIIYSIDENNYIIHKETYDDNLTTTFWYLVFTSFAESIPFFIRKKYSKFNYKFDVSMIKNKYTLIDISDVEKKLRIKKDNYNRLTR